MAVFKYKALDKEKKQKEGTIEAVNKDVAVETLQEKEFTIISIKELAAVKKVSLAFFQRIKSKDLVIFSRQFAVMIAANVAMIQALKILVEQTNNDKLKTVIAEVADEVDGGAKLSDALAKRPKIFTNFFVSVVRSGETSGKLDEVLNYLADEMEKDYDMMSKIKGAMIYPIFVIGGLIIVGTIMMIYVVPKLTIILEESGTALPLTTRIVIGVSTILSKYWWLILIILVAAVMGIRFYIRNPKGRKQFDLITLRLPIFGKLLQMIYLARFTRSMNTLLVGGVTITNSLKIASEVVSNSIYQELIEQTIKEVEDGNSISSVFIESKEVPKMVSQMLNIGEKTGKLDVMLERLTDFYSREIANIVANLMSLMEPLIMVIMGVAVAIMVAAIILPMYNLASQV